VKTIRITATRRPGGKESPDGCGSCAALLFKVLSANTSAPYLLPIRKRQRPQRSTAVIISPRLQNQLEADLEAILHFASRTSRSLTRLAELVGGVFPRDDVVDRAARRIQPCAGIRGSAVYT